MWCPLNVPKYPILRNMRLGMIVGGPLASEAERCLHPVTLGCARHDEWYCLDHTLDSGSPLGSKLVKRWKSVRSSLQNQAASSLEGHVTYEYIILIKGWTYGINLLRLVFVLENCWEDRTIEIHIKPIFQDKANRGRQCWNVFFFFCG